MSEVAIRVENLSKRYQIGAKKSGSFRETFANAFRRKTEAEAEATEFWALKDVSFDIKRGEAVGIIGKNGAGKSTLLKALSRITEPTRGRIEINGRVASLLEVGTGFHPELTGRENIFMNGTILGMTRREIRSKLDEIIDFSGVEKFIDTPVKRYSSGMYVRLAFAVAAHLEPEILIIDEVLAVGDAEFQKKCLGKMGEVAGQGRTVLFVSHNMGAVESLCTKGILLEKGFLSYEGSSGYAIKMYSKSAVNSNEIYHTLSKNFIWKGIKNRHKLDKLISNEDIVFELLFEIKNSAIYNFHLDCALVNEKNEWVVHLQSKFISNGFNLTVKNELVINYTVKSPKLSPGYYTMILYAYAGSEILFWAENIDACQISSESYFGSRPFFDDVRAPIMPEFNIEIKKEVVKL